MMIFRFFFEEIRENLWKSVDKKYHAFKVRTEIVTLFFNL